jgi:hypothetical protein
LQEEWFDIGAADAARFFSCWVAEINGRLFWAWIVLRELGRGRTTRNIMLKAIGTVAILCIAIVLAGCSASSRLENVVPSWANRPAHQGIPQDQKRLEANGKANTELQSTDTERQDGKKPDPGRQSAPEE